MLRLLWEDFLRVDALGKAMSILIFGGIAAAFIVIVYGVMQ